MSHPSEITAIARQRANHLQSRNYGMATCEPILRTDEPITAS